MPKDRTVLVVIARLHQVIAEGAMFSGHNQSAVTDPLTGIQVHINKFNMVFMPTVNYGPEKAVAVTLLVITGTGEIRFACGQDCVVAGYGDQLFNLHHNYLISFFVLDGDFCPFCHASVVVNTDMFIMGYL